MHEESGTRNTGDAGSAPEAQSVPEEVTFATVEFEDGFHNTDGFTCTRSSRVERFIKSDRTKLAGHEWANIFVLPSHDDPRKILGYYCVSAGQLERDVMSNSMRRVVPRSVAPMAMLGFMGRCDSAPKGTGEILLADLAMRLSVRQTLAVWGIMLHAENELLVTWYQKMGFKLAHQTTTSNDHNSRLMYVAIKSLLPLVN